MRKKGWPVTVSIGVATFIRPPNSVDETMKKADEMMFSVKNKGKNSIKYEIFPEYQDTEKVQYAKSRNFHS
jgi:PleD family two-component response regulator